MSIRFGPAGNADSFAQAGYRASVDAPGWLASLGLNAYEYQCGRGVHVGEETARRIGEQARAHGIEMSLHAPYFINLSSGEEERREKNIGYVLASCRAARWLGAERIVVHCGGLGKQSRQQAMAHTLTGLQQILAAMEREGYGGHTLCIETMGKQNVLGNLEEVAHIVSGDERLLPCIDFGHLNAREQGGCQSEEQLQALFDTLENTIGHERTSTLHAHFSKIEYGPKGEVRHLTFADTLYGPEFEPLARVLARRGYQPHIICESAGTQAEDACAMKKIYEETMA